MSVAANNATVSWPKPIPAPPVPGRPVYRFTVEQYYRMTELGILAGNDRVELLEGWILEKMSRNPPHDATITRALRRLLGVLSTDWVLRVQSAITLRDSAPEPDLVIARGPEEKYYRRHPAPRDIALAIEVASSSFLEDRNFKRQLYAQSRISCYWIINIVYSRVEVYQEPRAGRSPTYRQQQDYGLEDTVPLILSSRQTAMIPVRDLLIPE
jgi:hypothetical protein